MCGGLQGSPHNENLLASAAILNYHNLQYYIMTETPSLLCQGPPLYTQRKSDGSHKNYCNIIFLEPFPLGPWRCVVILIFLREHFN